MTKKEIKSMYMDFASATPMSENVYHAMVPYLKDLFYNPSALYQASEQIRADIEQARSEVAHLLGTQTRLIYFVDGATEANNLAIIGCVRAWQKKHPKVRPHIITTSVEHASVLSVFHYLESTGEVEVSYLSVNEKGLVSEKEFKTVLKDNTILVSIGYVNGEVGTIQDLKGIMKRVRHHRKHNQTEYPWVHSDAVQAVNYCSEIALNTLGIDMMVINAAKIYGPKKIAVLALRSSLDLEPIIHGGNQERKMRSGTENTAGIMGMATALKEARSLQVSESERLRPITFEFTELLRKNFPEAIINSSPEGSPHIVNISFPLLSHEEIMLRLDAYGIMCSVKSACKAGEEGDSHVILALRENHKGPTGSLRFSFGRSTTQEQIIELIDILVPIINEMKHSYEMYYPQQN